MAAILEDVLRLLREAYDKFSADGCARVGAALAYYSFFSLFPLLLLLISGLSYLLASGVPLLVNARSYVLERAVDVMPRAGELLERSIDAALAARGPTGIIGLFTLLWSASNVFTQLYQAFNVIWGCCPASGVRAAIRTKLTAVAVVLGISLLLLVSIVLNAAVAVAARHAQLMPGWQRAWARLASLSSVAMATAVFALLYRYLPSAWAPWRFVWPGALLAGVAWELLRQAFTVYTTRYADYAAVYGAVGSTIALLTWIYLSAQVLFFGAEFSVVYARFRSRARPQPELAKRGPDLRRRAALALRGLAIAMMGLWWRIRPGGQGGPRAGRQVGGKRVLLRASRGRRQRQRRPPRAGGREDGSARGAR